MKYCSECGMRVQPVWVAGDRRTRNICVSCGTTHYFNPTILVACILFCRAKILLCLRAHPPASGQWIVPSGYLECGETLEQCATRETFEETGVILDPAQLELYSVLNMARLGQVAVTFRAQIDAEPLLSPGSECHRVAFMSEDEISRIELAWSHAMGEAPRRLFEEMRAGQFGIYLSTLGSDEASIIRSRMYRIFPRA